MPKPYPRKFRDDVVNVAWNRDAGVTVEQIAKYFGVHPVTLFKWLRQADIDAGAEAGVVTVGRPGCAKVRSGSSCWSRRTRFCAGPLPTCRRRICREKALSRS